MAKKNVVNDVQEQQVEETIVEQPVEEQAPIIVEPVIEPVVYYPPSLPEGVIEVHEGDTIQSLSFTHGVGVQKILLLNSFNNVYVKLVNGQNIRIR
jgi:LysM repeat protein